MAGDGEEHEGASVQERLIHACRTNDVGMLEQIVEEIGDEEKVAKILNETKTVMGNHLLHEAALKGNYDAIDFLFSQDGLECDPINRIEGDTPVHSAIRWTSQQTDAEDRQLGAALVEMMLSDGASTRIRNKQRRTPLQLVEVVDKGNEALKDIIRRQEYEELNRGDFVEADSVAAPVQQQQQVREESSDDDAEFSGSDDEERAEWERRRKAKGKRV
ncbi:hypothetical protein PspLS_08181 [Pyricularia sp. CBS 133598]|nr:hypothetical protein PspLS_08181 [Pyricularia sp. CBS 133598]